MKLASGLLTASMAFLPAPSPSWNHFCTCRPRMNLFIAPTFSLMLISLSFRTISIRRFMSPMVFSAASAIPPVRLPSPITAATL